MTDEFRAPSPGDLAARRPGPSPADLATSAEDGGGSVDGAGTGTGAGDAGGVTGTGGVTAGTGDDRVDAALRRLDAVDELPVNEHVAQYEAVHTAMQDALATIDEG